jgi:hypothetical protein
MPTFLWDRSMNMKINTLEEARAAAFRGAYRGLRSQGWKPCMWGRTCTIRSADRKMCCTIGWLVPEHKIANRTTRKELQLAAGRVLELGLLADVLMDWLRGASMRDSYHFYQFLRDLMLIHDDHSPGAMRYELERLAFEHSIDIPE